MDADFKRKLNNYNFTLKKAFGQNFISDSELLSEIVASSGITEKDNVLEIGCGAGTLTRELARVANKVVGYEIDKSLEPLLKDTLSDKENVEIIFKDVMKEKLEDIEKKLGDGYVMVANLPYYITTPIIMRFLENSDKIKGMAVMVQEEVADRFSAKEGEPEYGAITVGINLRGHAEKVLRVGREKFTPVPKVDSAVIKITIDKNKNLGEDFKKIRETVKAAFSGRRKTLVNNLINYFKLTRSDAENAVSACGIKTTARGEELSAEKFVFLTRYLSDNFKGIYDEKKNNSSKRKQR